MHIGSGYRLSFRGQARPVGLREWKLNIEQRAAATYLAQGMLQQSEGKKKRNVQWR